MNDRFLLNLCVTLETVENHMLMPERDAGASEATKTHAHQKHIFLAARCSSGRGGGRLKHEMRAYDA